MIDSHPSLELTDNAVIYFSASRFVLPPPQAHHHGPSSRCFELLSRLAETRPVYVFEQPRLDRRDSTGLSHSSPSQNLTVLTPHLPRHLPKHTQDELLAAMARQVVSQNELSSFDIWYENPRALTFTRSLTPRVVVYACWSESLTAGFGSELGRLEAELLYRADLVFTHRESSYRKRCRLHPRVHCFPGGLVRMVSASAAPDSKPATEPAIEVDDREWDRLARVDISRPRFGWHGPLDERWDIEFLTSLATSRPDWHFVFAGRVSARAGRRVSECPNIHVLGKRKASAMPQYVAQWDASFIPPLFDADSYPNLFERSLELLSAGLSIVGPAATDLVVPQELGLITAVSTLEEAQSALSFELERKRPIEAQLRTDRYLDGLSWNKTVREIEGVIEAAAFDRLTPRPGSSPREMLLA